ncbi:hypothetical protein NQ315_005594 [Exocentrus adspersus]|uniref:Partial AB-hydrolase lipase domain-containing protein n=1 Tax=Exocentrus adspersus TaxID=1586481 RepID=A0AAV8VTU1_9CUCU|nr:hypothetical protein NQ315_005594 [Exocentrus adspersus]
MGIHDIRSTLKHVNEKTKKRPIYIGFSMGTTGFYIYSSTFPDEAKAHVKGMIALAPVINYKGIKSLIRITAMPPIWPILRYLTYLLWNGELLPNPSNYMWPFIKSSLGMYAFQTALNLFFGFDYKQMDALTYPVFPTHSLDSVGVEAYGHYVQIYQSGVFRNYDHGEGKNFEIYGQKHPPAYNLSKVSVPVALYVGKNDILATTASAEQLYSELPDGSRCGYRLVEFRKWNHVDFLIAKDVNRWGFFAEEHYLTTEDGYKILVERAYYKNNTGTPVVIVHGIAMNSLGFVNRGNISLAYLLGRLGYDVWLVNYRGTWYSKDHVNLSPKDPNYWSFRSITRIGKQTFSINEMGIHDIRSTLKHVNGKTKRKAIYIGYSMGTTGFYIYSTTFPDEAKAYVKGMIGLAPVINFKGTRSLFKVTTAPKIWQTLRSLIYSLWKGEILPGLSRYLKPLITTSTGMYGIQTIANLIFGDDYHQMDPLRYPVFATQLIDSMAVEVYGHYVQIGKSGVFRNYDHGWRKNMDIYGQMDPPAYNLSKVPVPVALYVGKNDILATPTNAKQLYSELPESSRCGYHSIEFPKWNHIDFLIAKDIMTYLYKHVFDKINQMDKENC